MNQRTMSRRDPEGRRRAIVQAAADLITEGEVSGLTHRKVAARAKVALGSTTHYFDSLDHLKAEALEHLARGIDEGLAEVARELAETDDRAAALAALLHGYLSDPVRVRTDTAFYVLSAENPDLLPLATRWFEGMVEILSEHLDPVLARAVAAYTDGAMVHATVHRAPLPQDELARALGLLMGGDPC